MGAFPHDPLVESLPLHVLHHQVVALLILAAVVDGADVLVVEGGDRGRLAQEALYALVVGVEDALDGDLAIAHARLGVPGQVDGAHAALAQRAEHLVAVGDLFTGGRGGWCDWASADRRLEREVTSGSRRRRRGREAPAALHAELRGAGVLEVAVRTAHEGIRRDRSGRRAAAPRAGKRRGRKVGRG